MGSETRTPSRGPMGRGPMGRGAVEKPKNFSNAIKRLFKELKLYKNFIIISLILAIASSILTIIAPNKLSDLTDEITKGIMSVMNMDNIKSISLLLAGLYIASALCSFIQSLSMTDVSNKFAKALRSRITHKITKLPLKYYDKHQTGDILSRVTNDIDTIAQSMNQSLASLVSASVLFLGTLIMMFVTNWIMAITAVGATLIGFIFMFMILKKSQKYFTARQVELGKINAHIEETYSGLNIVKVYNGKKRSDEKFDELNARVYDANRKSQFLSGLMQPIMHFVGNFGYVAVCIVGALLTMNNIITFGVIVAFITYVRMFTSPLNQIAQAMTSIQTAAAASERVFEFIDEKEMVGEEEIKTKLKKEEVKGEVEFKNVVFQYDDNDKPTINGFNSGDILIDGVSIKDLTRENIHDLFTMVLQDTWLFEGTIKENIKFNNDISDEEIDKILKDIGLNHFINTLPKGLDSDINDNNNISSGQRQLLTIARAMTEKTPFLILDEATSNVDTRTEEQVQEAMDKLAKDKTSFIIAHRLSTIKNADLILVLNHGDIIEQGNHEQLMSKNGFYADLYNSQFQLV